MGETIHHQTGPTAKRFDYQNRRRKAANKKTFERIKKIEEIFAYRIAFVISVTRVGLGRQIR
jgi:plasmid rolling circle replication initiator protein Rep